MNTKTKLLYVGFRALSTCCLYAAFLMITSCGDNVVNPDSPEPDGEDARGADKLLIIKAMQKDLHR